MGNYPFSIFVPDTNDFSFNKDHPILDSRKLIPKIVEIIGKLEAHGTGTFSKYYLNDLPELDLVIINPNLYTDPQWCINQLYDKGQTMSVAVLKKIVKEKEHKAVNYCRCDAYWLLLVIDFMDPAQDQEIRVNGEKLTSDVYEKILVYRTGYELVLEL